MKNKNFPRVLLTGLFLFLVGMAFAQPTVTSLTTHDQTPVITGTLSVAAPTTFVVTVNTVDYSATITYPTPTTWSLQLPSLPFATYSVTAVATGPGAGTDGTSNELVIAPDQSTTTGKTHSYSVDDVAANTFAWVITGGTVDVNYTLVAGAGFGINLPAVKVKWLIPGTYTLSVTQTSPAPASCTTTREFVILVAGDYDLQVVAWTPTNAATPWDLVGTNAGSNASAVCNAETGGTITNNSAVNGNADFNATNVVYFKVSLYNGTDLVNAVGDTKANWKFTLNDLSVKTGAWTAATLVYFDPTTNAATTVADPVTISKDGTSEIIVRATISPLASNALTDTNIVQVSATALGVDPSDAANYTADEKLANRETGTPGQDASSPRSNISYTYTLNPVPNITAITVAP